MPSGKPPPDPAAVDEPVLVELAEPGRRAIRPLRISHARHSAELRSSRLPLPLAPAPRSPLRSLGSLSALIRFPGGPARCRAGRSVISVSTGRLPAQAMARSSIGCTLREGEVRVVVPLHPDERAIRLSRSAPAPATSRRSRSAAPLRPCGAPALGVAAIVAVASTLISGAFDQVIRKNASSLIVKSVMPCMIGCAVSAMV